MAPKQSNKKKGKAAVTKAGFYVLDAESSRDILQSLQDADRFDLPC